MSATLTPLQAPSTESYAEISDPSLFKRARTWWTLAAICLVADENGFLYKQDNLYYHQTVAQRYASDPLLLLITIATWTICAVLVARHIAPTLRTMLKQKPMLAVAVFAVVSTLWSDVPLVTFRKSILLCFSFAFAWFFATYYPPADQRRMLLCAGAIMAVASVAWVIFLPSYGVATWGEVSGEWKGVFPQKNALGMAMVAFFSVLPFCRITNLRRLLALSLQAVLPLLLIVMSHSRESLVIAALFVGFRVLAPVAARSRKNQLPFIAYLSVTATVGIFLGWGMILALLGQGAVVSWSGRLTEWGAVVPYMLKHPWLGYGYAGFWTGEGDSLKVIKSLHVSVLGSDSGYTDNMLSFGLVGMGLLLLVLLASVRDFLRLLRRPAVPMIAFWYVGFILLTWVGAIVGNTFPVPDFATTFIFVVACSGLTDLRSLKPLRLPPAG